MPASSSADKQHLQLRGNKWRVVVSVPRDLQGIMGKTKLMEVLPTDSLAEANRLKWAAVSRLKRLISDQQSPKASIADALKVAAIRRRAEEADEDVEPLDQQIISHAEALAGRPIGTDHEGQPIFEARREAVAIQYAEVAMGRRTPIDAPRDRYLEQLTVKIRTRADDERAMGYLLDWCRREGVKPFLETFGKREAARFADDLRTTSNRSVVTLNKYINRLRGYWKWLESRGAVRSNVWLGRTYTAPMVLQEDKERPFIKAEMLKLLNGPATPQMHDLMRIGALTGARLEVIVDLKVGGCLGGTFTFKAQKKEPGARECPIHPDLMEIVERRTVDKAPDADFFPEWPPVKKENSLRERSFKTSGHFTDYRRLVGVDDQREGKRRSLINFHSFRRWFITEAERAGQPESTIQAVVGHRRASMAFGKYSAGPSLNQLKACVEAVSLPVPGVAHRSPEGMTPP